MGQVAQEAYKQLEDALRRKDFTEVTEALCKFNGILQTKNYTPSHRTMEK